MLLLSLKQTVYISSGNGRMLNRSLKSSPAPGPGGVLPKKDFTQAIKIIFDPVAVATVNYV